MLPAQLYDVALSGVDILGSFSVILLHNTLPPPKKKTLKNYIQVFFFILASFHTEKFTNSEEEMWHYVAAPDVKLGFTFGPQLEFDRPTTKPADRLRVPANLLSDGCRELLPNA